MKLRTILFGLLDHHQVCAQFVGSDVYTCKCTSLLSKSILRFSPVGKGTIAYSATVLTSQCILLQETFLFPN